MSLKLFMSLLSEVDLFSSKGIIKSFWKYILVLKLAYKSHILDKKELFKSKKIFVNFDKIFIKKLYKIQIDSIYS